METVSDLSEDSNVSKATVQRTLIKKAVKYCKLTEK